MYTDWEISIIGVIQAKLDITLSEAASLVEANPFILSQSWTKGLSPEETAILLVFQF